MLVMCQSFCDLFLFGLVWQYSSIQKNIMKVGSKPWLLTCISNITLSLPSLYFSESKRELNFCNGYLSLLYFWVVVYDRNRYRNQNPNWPIQYHNWYQNHISKRKSGYHHCRPHSFIPKVLTCPGHRDKSTLKFENLRSPKKIFFHVFGV